MTSKGARVKSPSAQSPSAGPVIAGVVGRRRFTYDVWGDAVNIAALMEHNGEPGRINVSEQVYQQTRAYFDFIGRGPIEAKNKGPVAMYFLDRLKPEFSKDVVGRKANERLFAMVRPTLGSAGGQGA